MSKTAVTLAIGLGVVLSSCSREASDAPKTAARPAQAALKIALLLPESKTARYESHDRPVFERKVKALCATCEILYSNADQDAAKQQSQAEAALTNGAQVFVLDPVDSAAAAVIVARAHDAHVPVISYDRLILNSDVDFYISFDNEAVGRLQAKALVDKVGTGTIVAIHGAPTDNNARLFKSGAKSVLEGSTLKVGVEYDTPDWSPDKAQQQMEQALTRLGAATIAGVYAANDGTAGGAIAAMKAAGLMPLPPVTGQDAELAAIQRIVAGEQFMTVYKPIRPLAERAAALAVALAMKQDPPAADFTAKVQNGKRDVPSLLLPPIIVTKENVKSTVLSDGFWSAKEVCTEAYRAPCDGLQL
jgi:D-xylose transport system substrate-binding protein